MRLPPAPLSTPNTSRAVFAPVYPLALLCVRPYLPMWTPCRPSLSPRQFENTGSTLSPSQAGLTLRIRSRRSRGLGCETSLDDWSFPRNGFSICSLRSEAQSAKQSMMGICRRILLQSSKYAAPGQQIGNDRCHSLPPRSQLCPLHHSETSGWRGRGADCVPGKSSALSRKTSISNADAFTFDAPFGWVARKHPRPPQESARSFCFPERVQHSRGHWKVRAGQSSAIPTPANDGTKIGHSPGRSGSHAGPPVWTIDHRSTLDTPTPHGLSQPVRIRCGLRNRWGTRTPLWCSVFTPNGFLMSTSTLASEWSLGQDEGTTRVVTEQKQVVTNIRGGSIPPASTNNQWVTRVPCRNPPANTCQLLSAKAARGHAS